MKYTFILQNLNCAHCAGKIEQKIAESKDYENVSFNFATKQLNLTSNKSYVKSDIQSICDSIEEGVNVLENIGCDKNKENNSKSGLVFLIISAVIGVSALLLELIIGDSAVWSFWLQVCLCFASILLAGYKTFIKGIKNIFKLRFDETALLTIAVAAAFCLGEFVEAAMVTILFAVGEFIEDKAVDASRHDIEKLAKIRPDTATMLINDKETVVSAEQVKEGSTIIVKPYERIPLDGVVISGTTTLDNSALTGESVPVDATVGSEVLSGAINGNSLIQIKTTKKFGDSTATRILKLVEDAAAQKGKSEKLISRFASIYTPIVIAIAVIIAVLPPILGLGAFSEWLYRALVCLVASCPCAIVISVPLAYYSGIGSASKFGVLIKGGKYLEALSKADTFVFDKTGTVTTGKLSVNSVMAFSDYSSEEVLAFAASAEKYSSHPIAAAIREKAAGIRLPQLSDYQENAGHGVSADYEGKKLGCGSAKILNEEQKRDFANSDVSVFVTLGGDVIGAIGVSDTIRAEAKNVIFELHNLGVKNTVMLTGDSRANAQKVCGEIGMSACKSELMPSDKLIECNSLKEKSKAVCFVGDGINDAPVLSASDCGIAMGLGSEAAIEASDAVLASGTLEQLPTAIKLSRKVMNTVRTNIVFAIMVKVLVIILAALGIASMWMSVIADTGVSVACVLYAARLLKKPLIKKH